VKDKFIIGGGISGLIFKYYNPDFTVIEAKDIGGQLNLGFAFKTVFLFDDEVTRSFLTELNIPFETEELKIRYFSDGELKDTVDPVENQKYIAKKLEHARYPIKLKPSDLTPRQSNEAKHLNVDMNLIVQKLSTGIEVIKQKVVLADVKNHSITLGNYKKFHYSTLVSTIPAPDFKYMAYSAEMPNSFKYLPGTFVVSPELPPFLKPYADQFDILYYVNDDMIFNRIWKHGDKFLYEIPGDFSEIECKYYLDETGIPIEKHFVRRVNVIFSEEIQPIPDVIFLGRLARWESNEFISDSINKALEFSKRTQHAS